MLLLRLAARQPVDYAGDEGSFLPFARAHRARAAARATRTRSSRVIFVSRALPPFRPRRTA